MSKTISIYTLYTGKRKINSLGPLYDELNYIIEHQFEPQKIWKKHRLDIDQLSLSHSKKMWIQKTNELIQNMSIDNIISLYAFTTPLFQDIQQFKQYGKIPSAKRTNILPIYDFINHIIQTQKNKNQEILPEYLWTIFSSIKKMPWVLYNPQKQPFKNIEKYKAIQSFEKKIKQNTKLKESLYDKGIILFQNKSDQRMFLYPQIRKCIHYIQSPNELVQQLSNLTHEEWFTIFQTYIKDIDALFVRMIPIPSKTYVYRGVHPKYEKKDLQSYTYKSTTLSKELAKDFGIVKKIILEKGTRVIPLFFVSRYFIEKEILLSPDIFVY